MVIGPLVLLYVTDGPVLSSLRFSLPLDGFAVADGRDNPDPSAAACLVIDLARAEDGMGLLVSVRAAGCGTPAVLLATNPTSAIRRRAAAAGATIVEKPLLGEELTRTLHLILQTREAA